MVRNWDELVKLSSSGSLVPVSHEVTMDTMGSGMSFISKRMLSEAFNTEHTALITDPKVEFTNHH